MGETRTISFYHIHTHETLTVEYMRDGKHVPEAMKQIDWLMRDWRKNESIVTDPNTVDLLWEMHTELGSKEPIHVICGYRSRGTNEMLRKTVGGQASQSQHITGKAIDVAFPDIPARMLRYSALVRERGGVGYYPTSGIPFVHVDTGRVRHWPRMPRDELALLFASGHSKHEPGDGRPISPADVKSARERKKDLAQQVAQYFDLRSQPKTPVMVASAQGSSAPEKIALAPPAPKPAPRPPQSPELRMSVGAPMPPPEDLTQAATKKLTGEPRVADRPAKFSTASADSTRLDMLVKLASLEQDAPPRPENAAPAIPEKAPLTTASLGGLVKPPLPTPAKRPAAILDPKAEPVPEASNLDNAGDFGERMAGNGGLGWRTAWAAAPSYDEDHPEEMTYRPFPVTPFLTESASFDDPALAQMTHPDSAETLALLDDEGSALPMRLRPGSQAAGMVWAQEFRGEAVSLADLQAAPAQEPAPTRIAERQVRTSRR